MDRKKDEYIELVAKLGVRGANEAMGIKKAQIVYWCSLDADFRGLLEEAKKEYHRQGAKERSRNNKKEKVSVGGESEVTELNAKIAELETIIKQKNEALLESKEKYDEYRKNMKERIHELTTESISLSKSLKECERKYKECRAELREAKQEGMALEGMKVAHIGRCADRSLYIFSERPRKYKEGCYSMDKCVAAITEYDPTTFGSVGIHDEQAKKIVYKIIKDW